MVHPTPVVKLAVRRTVGTAVNLAVDTEHPDEIAGDVLTSVATGWHRIILRIQSLITVVTNVIFHQSDHRYRGERKPSHSVRDVAGSRSPLVGSHAGSNPVHRCQSPKISSWQRLRRGALATLLSVRIRWRSRSLDCPTSSPNPSLYDRLLLNYYICSQGLYLYSGTIIYGPKRIASLPTRMSGLSIHHHEAITPPGLSPMWREDRGQSLFLLN